MVALKLPKKAQQPLRLSRRKLLARLVGVGALLAATPLSRMVHAQPTAPAHQLHSTWDAIVNAANEAYPTASRGADWLRSWMAGLVHQPERRMPGLMLVGPEKSGKTTIHKALGTLLARKEYVTSDRYERLVGESQFSRVVLSAWEAGTQKAPERVMLERGLVRQSIDVRFFLGGSDLLKNRFHWIECRTDNPQDVPEWMAKLALQKVHKPIVQTDLMRRLEDERDAFVEHLAMLDSSVTVAGLTQLLR